MESPPLVAIAASTRNQGARTPRTRGGSRVGQLAAFLALRRRQLLSCSLSIEERLDAVCQPGRKTLQQAPSSSTGLIMPPLREHHWSAGSTSAVVGRRVDTAQLRHSPKPSEDARSRSQQTRQTRRWHHLQLRVANHLFFDMARCAFCPCTGVARSRSHGNARKTGGVYGWPWWSRADSDPVRRCWLGAAAASNKTAAARVFELIAMGACHVQHTLALHVC
jgi:hypothetical protein